MNAVVENIGTCRKKLQIEWPAEKVSEEYQKCLAEYCKVAKIKGFRPGKAPVKVVEKRYAKQIIEDVRDRLVPQGYQQSIRDHNLTVVQVLEVEDPELDIEKPAKYSVTVEVAPEFDLPAYKGITLNREAEPVTDERVEETIQSIQEQFASYEEVTDRPVQKGDLVQVDFEGVCEGQPIEAIGESVKGLGQRKDFWVRADENAFLPEFADGLTGATIGEKREILVDFAAEFPVKELAGKKATYYVDIKALRERNLPPIDEEFLKRLGVDSRESLESRIREDLERAAEQKETNRLRNVVVDQLIGQVEMDLPESVVARETQKIIEEIVRENTSRGSAQEQLLDKKEEIIEVANRNAKNRVKAQFMLDAIADKEDVSVSQAQLNQHIERMATGYGMTPDALKAELNKRNAMDNVRDEFRRSLVVDHLMDQAEITESKE